MNPSLKTILKMREALNINEIPNCNYSSLYDFLYKSLLKTIFRMRKQNLKKTMRSLIVHCDEAYLGDLESSPTSDDCWKVGLGEEF